MTYATLQMGKAWTNERMNVAVAQFAAREMKEKKAVTNTRHLFSFNDKKQWLISVYDDECFEGIKAVGDTNFWTNLKRESFAVTNHFFGRGIPLAI